MPASNRSVLVLSALLAVTTHALGFSSELSHKLHALNSTVGGRLYRANPVSAPCFSVVNGQAVGRDQSACTAVEAGYTKPAFRVDEFGAYMNPEWETCQATSEQCTLDNTDPGNLLAWTAYNCSQGSVPPFYIDVRNVSDVTAAFEFSRTTKVPLVIKNSGHDYKGRSSKKDALALWVHNLKGITYAPSFTPSGCPASVSYPAITVGAGNSWQEIYDFAEAHNITAIGGYHQTIAASGGWVMGGGHSILSPVFGLGVDRVREFKIVTPDGEYRTANECQNTDLFWALRGGGGGTFGVIMESSHIVEPTPTRLSVASISFTGNTSVQAGWIRLMVDHALQWGQEGWGGHITGSNLINVTPLLTLEEAQISVANASAYALAHNGTAAVESLPSWGTFFSKYVLAAEAGVGAQVILGTRLMPTRLFQTAEGRDKLLETLQNTLSRGSPYIIQGTPFLYNGSSNATSVTPAWYDSLWHMSALRGTWNFNATLEEKIASYRAVHDVVERMREIAPESGAYTNEGDVYETEHEQAFWGRNYERLVGIKRRYDADGLLDCWQCVGWSRSAGDACYPDIGGGKRREL